MRTYNGERRVKRSYPSWRRAATIVPIVIVAFCWYSGSVTAQTLEPYVRIDPQAGLGMMRFSASGDYLLVPDFLTLLRYDLARQRFDRGFSLQSREYVIGQDGFGAISPDGTRLAYIAPTAPAEVHVIDFDSGELLRTLPYPVDKPHYDPTIEFAGNEQLLLKDLSKLFISDDTSGGWKRLPVEESFAANGNRVSSDGTTLLLITERFNDAGEYEEILRALDMQTLRPLPSSDASVDIGLNEPGVLVRDKAWVDDRPLVLYERYRNLISVLRYSTSAISVCYFQSPSGQSIPCSARTEGG